MTDQKTWALCEIALLREAFSAGKSRTEIAGELGRSIGSVRAKILSLGLRRGVRPWSGAEIAELKGFHAEGLPIADIAERIGRSVDAVTTMCHRLALKRASNACPWTPEQVDRLRDLLDEGHSLGRVAEIIGHPRSSVADKLRQLNLTSAKFRQPWTAEELRLMDSLYAAGLSLAKIARQMPGRSLHAIRLKLDKHLKRQAAAVAKLAAIRVVNDDTGRIRAPMAPAAHVPTYIPASIAEMERWLRTRDYMVLHRPDGWIVDRHHLKDEDALIEYVNARRQRFNLPLFVKHGGAIPETPVAPRPAPAGWRPWSQARPRPSA